MRDVLAQLLDRVELRGGLGELVVELGQLLLLDRRELDGDLDVLAGQVAAEQRGGEGLLLAGAQAAQGVVDALEHVARADLVGVAADLAALDGLAVAGRLEVDGDDVAVLGGALDVLEGGEALAQRLDLLVDVVVGDGRRRRPAR